MHLSQCITPKYLLLLQQYVPIMKVLQINTNQEIT